MSSHASSENMPSSNEAPSQTAQYNQNVDDDEFMAAVTAFQKAQKDGDNRGQVKQARIIISSLHEDNLINAAKVDEWGHAIDNSETNNRPFPSAVAKQMSEACRKFVQSDAW